jgi:tetratricopeptide (TPR) repeat protein
VHVPDDSVELAKAEDPLATADSLTQLTGDLRTREWMARLKAELLLAKRQYASAVAAAVRALSIQPTDGGRLVAAEAGLMRGVELTKGGMKAEARAAYRAADSVIAPLVDARWPSIYFLFGEIKHALGEDAIARTKLEAIIREAPTDEVARTLNYVCNEYLKDYDCALRTQRGVYETGRLRSYGDSLNAVEAAVLFGDYETGSRWLEPLLSRPASECERAVALLYAYWIASVRANAVTQSDVASKFAAIIGAGNGNSRGCWAFEGAKGRLSGSNPAAIAPEARTELLAMIQTLEARQ